MHSIFRNIKYVNANMTRQIHISIIGRLPQAEEHVFLKSQIKFKMEEKSLFKNYI